MTQKFTFTGLILLMAVFAFGQSFSEKKDRLSQDNQIEENKEKSDNSMHGIIYNRLSSTNIQKTKNPQIQTFQVTKQRLDSLVSFEWDINMSNWIPDWKEGNNYDTKGYMNQYLSYYWDEITNEWVSTAKEEYTFDVEGNLTEITYFRWDEILTQWAVIEKEVYSYDINGKMTQRIFYYWTKSSSQWITRNRSEYTYDANDNVTYLGYYCRESNSQCNASVKEVTTYNANGSLALNFAYYWDEIANQWVERSRYEYSYDTNGNMTQKIYYYWSTTIRQWFAEEKTEFSYDDFGNLTQEKIYIWDGYTSQWFDEKLIEYNYDNSHSFNNLILTYYYSHLGMYFNHMLTGYLIYEKDPNGSWLTSSKVTLYYSAQNFTGTDVIKENNIELYPNPVSENFNLCFTSTSNTATFELFDMQGRRLMSKEISNNEQLSLGGLKSGVYLYCLSIDDNKQSGKLVKK